MERYPEGIILKVEDFRNCEWQKSIENSDRDCYSSMWQSLSSSAREAIEKGDKNKGKALWLLADACSMMLKPSSLNEPFKPFAVFEDKRSSLPQDFTQEDISLFSSFVEEISDPKLCARISDLLWMLLKPRDPKYAVMAIDQYRSLPITTDYWVGEGRECWKRAIQLCLMLKAGAGERLKEIEELLTSTLESLSADDGYLALWISDLLSKHHLARGERNSIAEKIKEVGGTFEDSGELHRARDYFECASELYKKINDDEQFSAMVVKVAESWVNEAIARQSSDSPSQMVAAEFYENAIQRYRTIPRARREELNVDSRIDELRTELSKAGENSLTEMGVIKSPSIDITEIVEASREAVRDKPVEDSLFQLANIHNGAKYQKLREYSEKMIREYPLQSLFSSTHMSADGRVVAKRPGADLGGGDNEDVIWPEMVKHYVMEITLIVQGQIWPALEAMRQEHILRESDFHILCRQSPIVPNDRTELFAKFLYEGYDNDFVSALHILIPQLENLVRVHLKQTGAKTTNLDKNGIENENGLSTLVELPEFETVFGEDLGFEIKALFCSAFGPNLRNELAHGLIGYNESQSIYSIYAWWVGLRIMFNTFWNARNGQSNTEEKNQTEEAEHA